MMLEDLNGTRVTVHYNLRKRLWSVTSKGRVVAHLPTVCLRDARQNYAAALHAHVVDKRCRKVYLKVSGFLDLDPEFTAQQEVRAHPYRNEGQFHLADGTPWREGAHVLFPADPADPTRGAGFLMV